MFERRNWNSKRARKPHLLRHYSFTALLLIKGNIPLSFTITSFFEINRNTQDQPIYFYNVYFCWLAGNKLFGFDQHGKSFSITNSPNQISCNHWHVIERCFTNISDPSWIFIFSIGLHNIDYITGALAWNFSDKTFGVGEVTITSEIRDSFLNMALTNHLHDRKFYL